MNKRMLLGILLLVGARSQAQSIVRLQDLMKEQKENSSGVMKMKGKPFTGTVVNEFANGKPQLWKEVRNGLADGLWQEWYENGHLRFSAYWREGKGQGEWHYYHENGAVRQDEFYNADIPVGIFSVFYNNGQLKQKGGYLNGKKDGTHESYSESGVLVKQETYKDGVLFNTKQF